MTSLIMYSTYMCSCHAFCFSRPSTLCTYEEDMSSEMLSLKLILIRALSTEGTSRIIFNVYETKEI